MRKLVPKSLRGWILMVLFFGLLFWWFKDTHYYRDDYSQLKVYKLDGSVYGGSLNADFQDNSFTFKLYRIDDYRSIFLFEPNLIFRR